MRILVDTGVFSASLSRRRRPQFETHVALMAGHQIFLAAVTVSELRYGVLVAGWGQARRQRLEESIKATTVVPVSDRLLTTAAELRHTCRAAGHSLPDGHSACSQLSTEGRPCNPATRVEIHAGAEYRDFGSSTGW